MDLVSLLLERFGISQRKIPTARSEIDKARSKTDKVDLEGRIQPNGDFEAGLRNRLIVAVGYFRIGEYFEAARYFERAIWAARLNYDPETIALIAQILTQSLILAKERKKSPKSEREMIKDIAWAYSKLADEYVDVIQKRLKEGNDTNGYPQHARIAIRNAISLFNHVRIDPFTDSSTYRLFQRLEPYAS